MTYELGRYQDKVLEIHGSADWQPMTDKSHDEANLARRKSRLVELLCLLKRIQQSRNTPPDSLEVEILVNPHSPQYSGASDQQHWRSIAQRVIYDTMAEARNYILDKGLHVTIVARAHGLEEQRSYGGTAI